MSEQKLKYSSSCPDYRHYWREKIKKDTQAHEASGGEVTVLPAYDKSNRVIGFDVSGKFITTIQSARVNDKSLRRTGKTKIEETE